VGYFYDGDVGLDPDELLGLVTAGMTPEYTHATEGYPEFTDWPNAWASSTHQTQYYRWLERAYRGGLRLVIQHATGNSVLCEFVTGLRAQSVRYSCNDMVSVDRQILEARNMERYIDAQSGGPGQGWFRIVESPAEAREVINSGKLAVVLGIEISNVFDCFLTPTLNDPVCDLDHVRAQLDHYHDLGVRVLFPNHKYDNAFTPGDGARGIIELGNAVNSGHWSNYTLDCPPRNGADEGDLLLGGLNMPRAEFMSDPPFDFYLFPRAPALSIAPLLTPLMEGPAVGDYCQNGTLTTLGEQLFAEMMQRGMIIEIDHLPRKSYNRAFEILEANDYPAMGTHGRTNNGRIYQIGGLSKTGFGRCADPNRVGSLGDSYRDRIALITANGGYPSEGFGFDLNGFAGSRRPRFGPNGCSQPQANPVTYPFTSYAGDVTFEEPQLGSRSVDFNTEGMIHLGLLPELIEDVRRDGVTDEDLEPLFRSAEAYLRVWERSEMRGAAMR
jgi:microsomal dipeptidase-like Zn-dependent dipeptidase